MKLIKWLKRDRRSSDTQAMVTSPQSDSKTVRDDSYQGNDPIRTKEYIQALSEFRARRSLGPNLSFEKTSNKTPTTNIKQSCKNEERRSKSDQKPKRRSLPETGNRSQIISQTLPQIQFLFSNQIFMPGNGMQIKKKSKKQKNEDKRTSIDSISTNLKYLADKQVEFDADDYESPRSPPADFFGRDNSLPYMDQNVDNNYMGKDLSAEDITMPLGNDNRLNVISNVRNSDARQLLSESSDDYQSLGKLSKNSSLSSKAVTLKAMIEEMTSEKDTLNPAETSFESVARKLEEECSINGRIPGHGYFRGVPLIRSSALRDCNVKELCGVTTATWSELTVTLREPLDGDYQVRDINILSTIRHPNILLLMGIGYDLDHRVQCIFEECTITLYSRLHQQKSVISYEATISYLSDIASAVSHLYGHGYVHTAISSHTIVITPRDVAKLCGFELCSKILERDQDNEEESSLRKLNCDPYKLIYSSPEPEYENLKGCGKNNGQSDEEPLMSYRNGQDCSLQNVAEREMIAHYRWQAPELFDDVEGQVAPTKTSDVYSLCLILWECCNDVVPWNSLSYKQLSDLYLLWQTGIRLTKDRYNEIVYDILSEGLYINPEERISIKSFCNKIHSAKNSLNVDIEMETETEEMFRKDIKYPSKKPTKFIDNSTQLESNYTFENDDGKFMSTMNTDIPKYQVTDIDNVDNGNNQYIGDFSQNSTSKLINVNMSSIPMYTSKEYIEDSDYSCEMSPDGLTMHKTDSTEYCSLVTPDIRKFVSRLQNSNTSIRPSKLSFNDESLPDVPESTLQEKIMRLNSNFTPKSYKPLDIKTPPTGKLCNIAALTGSARKSNKEKQSNYNFDVKHTSLPTTPIARNTTIRKYAWLSGENGDDLGYNETTNSFKPDMSVNVEEVKETFKMSVDKSKNIILSVNSKPDLTSKEQRETSNLKNYSVCGTSEPNPFSNRNSFKRASVCSKRAPTQNLCDKFRVRSQSWGSRPPDSGLAKSSDNITGVDIKPLVAIHEKWIAEAKVKQNRSQSVPDTYRGPIQAVKPASHRVDPALPYIGVTSRPPLLISSSKPITRNSPKTHLSLSGHSFLSTETFEKCLWKKEKEKCQLSTRNENDPRGSSTPYKVKTSDSPKIFTDQSTNTETFEQLCENILKQLQIQDYCSSIDPTESQFSSLSPKYDGKNNLVKNPTKSKNCLTDSVMAELNDIFKRMDKSDDPPQQSENHQTIETVEDKTLHISNEELIRHSNAPCNHDPNPELDEEDCEGCFTQTQEDDSLSLPELKGGEIVNKALKRCQAFSALQSARSTEDMYIDDELSVNNDVHALTNMQLVSMHGSIHESLCDKANDCCLIKIKEESISDRILIICENPCKSQPRSSCSDEVSDDEELQASLNFSRFNNLEVVNLPSMDLVDLAPTSEALPSIQEVPSEEELADSVHPDNTRNIQDLISLYESVNSNCSLKTAQPKCFDDNTKENRVNEISFLILDNQEECDGNVINTDQKNDLLSDSVIQDYIMI